MKDREIELTIGSLLHDVGKVIYRQGGDKRKHSESGYDYLQKEAGIEDKEILNCVRYHHGAALRNAPISDDALAYITYIADNIASAADRRKSDSGDVGFEMQTPLESVFNILNGNHEKLYYRPLMLDPEGEINYPQKEKIAFDEYFYSRVKENITDNLSGIEWNQDYINSLLEVMESNLTYVPSSTARDELADISLYDHVKMTAAIAACIYQYAEENGIRNYKKAFFEEEEKFYNESVFCLFSMDISGIQNFIYTISSDKALRMLRSRSFYLELMMEHLIDTVLDGMNLTRANLIYSGGGHCYLILPNTIATEKFTTRFLKDTNHWMMEQFGTALYVAGGLQPCSSTQLNNKPEGSYSDIFRKMSSKISDMKMHRYSAEEILSLNHKQHEDYTRECKVCKNISQVDQNGICPMCNAILALSGSVLEGSFFSIICREGKNALPLPGGVYLVSDTESSLRKRMADDPYYVRSYSINSAFTGKQMRAKLWAGNYHSGDTFEILAEKARGIKRLGVIRADVDNMGHAFVAGFDGKYATLSRTATLSRQLSLFFKLQINKLLSNPECGICRTGNISARDAAIVYSGGDDLFIVGAWDELLEASFDIRHAFARYVQNTMTISAGFEIYPYTYPISVIAEEVAGLEERSKEMPGKNAMTLLPDGKEHPEKDGCMHPDGTYNWDQLELKVIHEKLKELQEFFQYFDEERGNSFLYHLLELIREREEKINMARYVYLLSRLEPGNNESPEKKNRYKAFSRKMYEWYQTEENCRQLKTACTLYIYLNRERKE